MLNLVQKVMKFVFDYFLIATMILGKPVYSPLNGTTSVGLAAELNMWVVPTNLPDILHQCQTACFAIDSSLVSIRHTGN